MLVRTGTEMALHGGGNELGAGKNSGWETGQYRQRFLEMTRTGNLGTSWQESLAGDLVYGRQRLCGKESAKCQRATATKRKRSGSWKSHEWDRFTSAIVELWRKPWKESQVDTTEDPGRELAMLIARRYGGMSLRETGLAVGRLQDPAVSDAVRRTSARLERDRALEKMFKRLSKIHEGEGRRRVASKDSRLSFDIRRGEGGHWCPR